MIDARDLRIGNLVYSPMMNDNFKISNLTDEYNPTCQPIPLTEEWLVRLGFQKESKEYFIKINNHSNLLLFYSTFHDKYYYFADVERRQYNSTLPMLYVHQIQNLYYSLTGQELEMK